VHDGIDYGTLAEIAHGVPMSAAGQRKRGINFRCSLAKADNCRLDFSVSLAVLSLLVGRKAYQHKGLGHRLTTEWE
jgi:hypothetical protein